MYDDGEAVHPAKVAGGQCDTDETPPNAADVAARTNDIRLGEKFLELDIDAAISILECLSGYNWPIDGINEIGLTDVNGAPRHGVLTLRHLHLAMTINKHLRKCNSGFRWSTNSINARPRYDAHKKEPPRKVSALPLMGSHTEGPVHTRDGTLQVHSDDADPVIAIDRPYSSLTPTGKRYVIKVHNHEFSARVLPKDHALLIASGSHPDRNTHVKWSTPSTIRGGLPPRISEIHALLIASGFHPDGSTHAKWSTPSTIRGGLSLRTNDLHESLIVEVCCGETSELCKLTHTGSKCLGTVTTARRDVLNARTQETMQFCISQNGLGRDVFLRISFRCTGGYQLQSISAWRAIHRGYTETLRKIDDAM